MHLTTNGVLLKEKAAQLKQAGIDSINVSLDTPDEKEYRVLTGGGKLSNVLDGIIDVANTIANQMNFDITNNNVVNTVTTFKGSYAGRLSVTKDIDTIKTISNPSTLNSSVYNYETKKYTQIYDYDKIKSLDKYDIYLSGASSIIDIVNPISNSNRELIVFRDSYGSSLVPLLIEGYKKITVVDIRYVSSRILNNYIKFNDQDVLFMYSILTINNSFSIR